MTTEGIDPTMDALIRQPHNVTARSVSPPEGDGELRSASDLAADVRGGILPPHAASNRYEHQKALAALADLVERLEASEAENERLREDDRRNFEWAKAERQGRKTAEARLFGASRRAADAENQWGVHKIMLKDERRWRAEAEAQVAALTQEREGYKRDFLAASERVEAAEAALADRNREIQLLERKVADLQGDSLCPDCGIPRMWCKLVSTNADHCWRWDDEARRSALAALADARRALERADREASVAHDAIWSNEVASCGRLHDNDDPLSAQSAIWRLHDIVRGALAAGGRTTQTSGMGSSAADVDGAEHGHHESVGERQGRQPIPEGTGPTEEQT